MMMKVLAALPRVVLGAVLLLSGIAGLLHLAPTPVFEGPAAAFMAGLTGSYLFTLVKLTEIAAGALLLSNRFVPLALAVVAPVLINIAAFHLLYAPSGLAVPIVLIAAELSLVWKYRSAFAPMLAAKAAVAPEREPRQIAAAA